MYPLRHTTLWFVLLVCACVHVIYLYDVFACLMVQRLVSGVFTVLSVTYSSSPPLIVLALYTPHQSLLSTAAALN